MTKKIMILILMVFGLTDVVIISNILRNNLHSQSNNRLLQATDIEDENKSINHKSMFLRARNNTLLLDDGTQVVLRGVTSNFFRKETGTMTMRDLLIRLDQVRLWGANTVQLYVNPDIFVQQSTQEKNAMQQLHEVIQWGVKNDMYIILNPVNDVQWDQTGAIRTSASIVKRDKIASVLLYLSQIYGSYSNVMFGIEAEPKFIDTLQTFLDRISAVRYHSEMPILIPVYNFSGSLQITLQILDGHLYDENMILDYHYYYGKDIANMRYGKELSASIRKEVNTHFKDKYPIIFGEFGGFW